MLNREHIIQKLIQDYDYPESQVSAVVTKLSAMDPILVESFYIWYRKGIMPNEPTFGGFTPKSASVTYSSLKPPAIFLLLDWLRRDPQEALQALAEDFGTSVPVDSDIG